MATVKSFRCGEIIVKGGGAMAARINRAIELLMQDQAIYYVGGHTGHVLTREQGRRDAQTWADYINVGMEHGAFDPAGLDAYMLGLSEGGPTASGHRTPPVIVEAPVNGTDEANVRFNAWQFRQILSRGAHGILLCQAESPAAVRAFVESCRYPLNTIGLDPTLPTPLARMAGAERPPLIEGSAWLGIGTRGRGGEPTAAPIWGLAGPDYLTRCDPWPLTPLGELLLGVKLESPEGIANCEAILAVPGIGFAELGPGDLSLALGYPSVSRAAYPPELLAARDRVFAACRANGIPFLDTGSPETVAALIDEGVRVFAGHNEETAQAGRAYQRRTMPV
jgi:2-keto-3-deoxy-L-rhamnonate aldolase RhmA